MNYHPEHQRPQDDIPYERRMLYIIRDYRRLLQANETLETYCKSLEQSNKELLEQNDSLRRINDDLRQKKSPEENTICSLQALVKEKRETIQYQNCRISMMQRELNEYKKRYGEL